MILKTAKFVGFLLICTTTLVANTTPPPKNGVNIDYIDEDDNKQTVTIKRIQNKICTKVDGTNPEVIWADDYASNFVNKSCKKTYITTVGKITPGKIAKGIETYTELEVIKFMEEAQTNKNLMLVDARLSDWYFVRTIPSSVNIPFTHFNPKKQPDEFEDVLDMTNVKIENGKYDFTNAKTLLLFCNGSWCPQSSWAIKNLIKVGYPKNKLLWYRGGLYSWTSVNLTTIVPE